MKRDLMLDERDSPSSYRIPSKAIVCALYLAKACCWTDGLETRLDIA